MLKFEIGWDIGLTELNRGPEWTNRHRKLVTNDRDRYS